MDEAAKGLHSGMAADAFSGIFNLHDFEALARARLPEEVYAYIAGGAGDETTLAENEAAFRRYRLRSRVLVDVSRVDTATTVLDRPVELPVGMAPTALQGLAHPGGEVAAATAVAAAGGIYCLSTISSRSLEEVAAAGGRRWFQFYVQKDRGFSRSLVERAAAAGYEAIVLTGDLPMPGYRERELRLPLDVGDDAMGNFVQRDASGELMSVIFDAFDSSLSWRDIEWLRSLSDLPIVLKGVMTAEDAALASQHGCDAIVVSNHGGRQLDRSRASIDALGEIVDAVGDDLEIYLDGGVRRGIDAVIALSRGARAVFLGRSLIYALCAGGGAGVTHALGLMRAEMENVMAQLGASSIDQLTRACLV
jgi:4-hydroxymandelate oxidase